jgi:Protein of unknown function (DUF3179)
MQQPPPLPPRALKPRTRVAVVAALVGVIAAASAWSAWYAASVRWTRPGSGLRPDRWASPEPATRADFVRADIPGVRQPHALAAGAARLPGGAAVIGLSVGHRHRAYALQALAPITRHVVNDLLGRVPVTVTYCARNGCVGVFTDADRDRPLDVAVAGWVGPPDAGSLVLRVGSERYRQDTGAPLDGDGDPPFPYARAEYERTTWEHWREEYPDTDVYVGEETGQ